MTDEFILKTATEYLVKHVYNSPCINCSHLCLKKPGSKFFCEELSFNDWQKKFKPEKTQCHKFSVGVLKIIE